MKNIIISAAVFFGSLFGTAYAHEVLPSASWLELPLLISGVIICILSFVCFGYFMAEWVDDREDQKRPKQKTNPVRR